MKTIVYSVLLCVSFIALVILYNAFPYIYLLLAGGGVAYLVHWLLPVPSFGYFSKIRKNAMNLLNGVSLNSGIFNQKAGATLG